MRIATDDDIRFAELFKENDGEFVTAETLDELSNNKGEDEDE